MLFQGKAFRLTRDGDTLELRFDTDGASVNVFNRPALDELGEVLDAIEGEEGVDGLIVTSGKKVFVAGADINEFLGYFAAPDAELAAMLDRVNAMFNRLEDLPFPSVAAINGEAQGGGFEVCLACDFRVMAPAARVGLPEVKLGIMPGWGGSVRLSRLIGVDNAVEWMCTGASKKAPVALADGAADAVVAEDHLMEAARAIVAQVKAGDIDLAERRQLKTGPLQLSELERTMAIESAKGVVGAKAGPHYPSPLTIIDTVAGHGTKSRDEALPIESKAFVELAKSDVAESLVGIFLNDQQLKRIARGLDEERPAKVEQAPPCWAPASWAAASPTRAPRNGVPIVMKDIDRQGDRRGPGRGRQAARQARSRAARMKPEAGA